MEKSKAIPGFKRVLLWLLLGFLVWLGISVLFPRMMSEIDDTSSVINQR